MEPMIPPDIPSRMPETRHRAAPPSPLETETLPGDGVTSEEEEEDIPFYLSIKLWHVINIHFAGSPMENLLVTPLLK
mgnify:CR=1 FL=1